MTTRNCLVLTQYRQHSTYNDFIGKFYHFPATKSKNYLGQFASLPIEFVYFEPQKNGAGEFYGYGRITRAPFPDKREKDHYFAEISYYRQFTTPVKFRDNQDKILEETRSARNYNPQNAVRKIDCDLLDDLCLDGGIQLNFEADAHLVQVLGEQLIGSERVGILELVKNAYDAGSPTCRVRIENVPGLRQMNDAELEFPGLDGPVVIIEDFGHGMSRFDIENGWLRPASTLKTQIKERLRTEKDDAIATGRIGTFNTLLTEIKKANHGRVPLGEKGVGRFAAHRLGRKLTIRTKTRSLPYELRLDINWDDFDQIGDQPIDLKSIGVSLSRQQPSRDYGKQASGTQLVIYGGKDDYELTTDELEQIDRSLRQLNSPHPPPDSKVIPFAVTFECPQVDLLDSGPIYEEFPPVFTISGTVDERGVFTYDFSFDPPDAVPLPKEHDSGQFLDLRTRDMDKWLSPDGTLRDSACGPFYLNLQIWYRSTPWLTGPDRKLFTEYLDTYGGISVYRDGINVFPAEWGAEVDWLRLSKRHIKRGLKISYYNMIGNLEIAQGPNITLVDKTSREGIIANKASADLTLLTRSIVLFTENHFITKRNAFSRLSGDIIREPKTLNSVAKQTSAIIRNIHEKYDFSDDPLSLLTELGDAADRERRLVDLSASLRNLEKSLNEMQEIRELLTEQAGFGLGIAVAIHEITKTASNFYRGITDLIRSKRLDMARLEELKDASGALQSELKRLSPLRAIRTEKPQLFQLSKSIEFARGVFKLEFEKLGIVFEFNRIEDIAVNGRFGAVNQIFTNLFDNSCYWMKATEIGNRRIGVEINARERTVVVADNGPDIDDSILPYLFEPGYSLRFPPSGIGLYVCKHYMRSMKGDIYLTPRTRRLDSFEGAQFTLDFSRVKDSSTN